MNKVFAESDEWADWYRLTPSQRWRESQKLLAFFIMAGGSYDPESDSQSPFYDAEAGRAMPAHGRAGVRFYGAAEFSRDTDLALLAEPENLKRLQHTLDELPGAWGASRTRRS